MQAGRKIAAGIEENRGVIQPSRVGWRRTQLGGVHQLEHRPISQPERNAPAPLGQRNESHPIGVVGEQARQITDAQAQHVHVGRRIQPLGWCVHSSSTPK